MLVSTVLQALVPTGNISKSGKIVSRSFDLKYGPDEDHLYSTGFAPTVTIDASSVYDDGWGAARAKVKFPTTGSTASMSIEYPPSIVDSDAITRTYTISDNGKNAVKLTGGGYTVAEYTHGKYDAGWAAARALVEFPTDGAAASMGIKYPPSTVDGSAVTRTYTLSNDGDNAVKLTGGGYTVAKLTHNKYSAGVTAGKNAVGLTISTSDAKIKRNQSSNALTEVAIALNTGSRDSNGNRTIQVAANTTVLLSTVINDYNAGYDAGVAQAGGSAWFDYTSSRGSSSDSSFIDISNESTTRYIYVFYRKKDGTRVNKTNVTWYLPKAMLFQNVSKGATNEELTPNTYICVGYSRGGYSGDYKESGHTYHVPSGGSTPTLSVTSPSNWRGASKADVLDRMGISSFDSEWTVDNSYPYRGIRATCGSRVRNILVHK